jgi:hypothetical protein
MAHFLLITVNAILSPSKERKQPSNVCSKQYNKKFVLCLLAAPLLWWPKRELWKLKLSTYFRFVWFGLSTFKQHNELQKNPF